ncbi:FAD-dependent oxidoreductase [Streptomyces sp. URMC 123]|uniref:FAD-dependent oxidoreductase n=1 Tax=Streptomyces sp. URMC 123 TaxID=3423403 RepID=UPI003F1C173F
MNGSLDPRGSRRGPVGPGGAGPGDPVVVIGAGPYGLSAAAHLRARGVPVRVFGDPMVSWRQAMPAGMLLKSTPAASTIDAPQPGHTLADFCAAVGGPLLVRDDDVVPLETFVQYGLWFQERLVPDLERVRVVSVDVPERGPGPEPGPGGLPGADGAGRRTAPLSAGRPLRRRTAPARFEIKLDSGEQLRARAVVVATGLTGLAHLPPELAAAVPGGPSATGPVSHSSQHSDLARFAGREVAVIGAGQSALESAVLLHEAGADVWLVARRHRAVGFGAPPWRQPRLRPASPFGNAWSLYALSNHAAAYRFLPAPARHELVRRVLGPLGAWWLRDRFEGRVRVTAGWSVAGARVAADGRVGLTLTGPDGSAADLSADHVLAATGYRMSVAALGFLGTGLRASLAVSRGTPRLGADYRSSVPGLYFTGLPAAASYGPLMRFVCGTGYASRRLTRAIVADAGG